MANIFSDEYWDRLYDMIINNDRTAMAKELESLERMYGKDEKQDQDDMGSEKG